MTTLPRGYFTSKRITDWNDCARPRSLEIVADLKAAHGSVESEDRAFGGSTGIDD